MNIKEDSKKHLVNCFINLLNKYQFKEISVVLLCKEANLNRSTFYKHFIDIYDLSEFIENELSEKLLKNLYHDYKANIESESLFENLFKELERNKNEYLVLNYISTDLFYARLFDKIKKYYYQYYKNQENLTKEEIDYIFIFNSAGMISVIKEWLKSDTLEARKMAKLLTNILDGKYLIK